MYVSGMAGWLLNNVTNCLATLLSWFVAFGKLLCRENGMLGS
jgi:hypothetical protein